MTADKAVEESQVGPEIRIAKQFLCEKILARSFARIAPLAQLAEQLTLNQRVAGSIPARCSFSPSRSRPIDVE
jgi:hypothetical protein